MKLKLIENEESDEGEGENGEMGRRNAIRREVLFEGGEYGRGENVKANE